MTTATRIDPLRPCPDGRYEDDWVVVERSSMRGIHARREDDGRLRIEHRLRPSELDDDLGDPLARVLARHTRDHEVFARAFTGIVLTSFPQPSTAWEVFYRNSLARLRSRNGYSTVYRHALTLLPRTIVVDLGCSFGFLALELARSGVAVTACDVDPGTTDLLLRLARRLRIGLDVVTSTGDDVPLPDRSADAVALLHVLEHVDESTGATLLAEAMRIARRRVVVAVPFEDEPDGLFGHVRRFTVPHLLRLGVQSGWAFDVHEDHGGWLTLDRPPA